MKAKEVTQNSKQGLLSELNSLLKTERSGIKRPARFGLRLLDVRFKLIKVPYLDLGEDVEVKEKFKELYDEIFSNELLRILMLPYNRDKRRELLFDAQELFCDESSICQKNVPYAYSYFPHPAYIMEVALQLL